MSEHEAETSREPQPPAYYQVACFPNEALSWLAYRQSHEVLSHTAGELSAFYFRLECNWYAVVLGDPPPEEDLPHRLEGFFSLGEPTTLSESILYQLERRRLAILSSPKGAVRTGQSPLAL